MKKEAILLTFLFILAGCTQYPGEYNSQSEPDEMPPSTKPPEELPPQNMMVLETDNITFFNYTNEMKSLYKLKVTITNTFSTTKKFKVTLQGIEEIARLITPRIVTLQSGESKTVELYLEPKQRLKLGSYIVTAVLLSGSEVLEAQELAFHVMVAPKIVPIEL